MALYHSNLQFHIMSARLPGPYIEGLLRKQLSSTKTFLLLPTNTPTYHHGCDPTRRPPRLLILLWLIVWITSVPLFHLHLPDLTDRWSTLHSGGVHTVLTPDLPGEYASSNHDAHREHSAHFAPRVVNSPELNLVLFGGKTNRWDPLTVLGALSHVSTPSLIFLFSIMSPASRAPPRSV